MLMTILLSAAGALGVGSLHAQDADDNAFTVVAAMNSHRLLDAGDLIRVSRPQRLAAAGIDDIESSGPVTPASGGTTVHLTDESVLVDAPEMAKEEPPPARPIQNVRMPMSSAARTGILIAAGVVGLGVVAAVALVSMRGHFTFSF